MVHSLLRWVILPVAVLALVKLALGLIRKTDYDKMTNRLVAGYSGLMDLQSTLGFIFMLWSGLADEGFPRYRIDHAVALLLAVVVAHLPARWKSKPAAERHRNTLLAIIVSLVLVAVGVNVVGGWSAQ
jgi:hypothetical protein